MALTAVLGMILLAAVGSQVCVSQFLPNEPITRANFRTMPAPAAYLKNVVLYFLPLALVFVALPFHTVLGIQTAARRTSWASGRYRVDARLCGPSTMFIRPRTLWILLACSFPLSLVLGARLLEGLEPGPYTNIFIQLVFGRGFLFFATAVECMMWYHITTNRLRQVGAFDPETTFGPKETPTTAEGEVE